MAADPTGGLQVRDALWVAISADGLVRARAVIADHTCADAASRHQLSPLATRALARAAVCTALVPASWKDVTRVSVQWAGAGVLKSVFAEVRPSPDGITLRGYVRAPTAALWAADPHAPLVGRAIAPGVVRLLRQTVAGAVSHGEVELVTGEFDDDLEALFAASEQVLTRLRAHVTLTPDGHVLRARGVLVQLLPGADPDQLPPLLIDDTSEPAQVLTRVLGADCQILEQTALRFGCPCTRERALAGLSLLTQDDIIDMIAKEGGSDVTCEMCAQVYRFSPEDLLVLVEGGSGDA